MTSPKYILKTNEAVLMPKNQSAGIKFLKIGVWVIIGIIILGSLIFQENLFFELPRSTRILLIVVAIGVLFVGSKKENVSSPMELQFYDDYLILYRPKRYYSRKVTRMKVNKLMYTDIKRCVYKKHSKRLHIYGNVAATWYDYDSNGVVSQVPTYNRVVEDAFCYFSTSFAKDVDFKQAIENYSPLQVTIENS